MHTELVAVEWHKGMPYAKGTAVNPIHNGEGVLQAALVELVEKCESMIHDRYDGTSDLQDHLQMTAAARATLEKARLDEVLNEFMEYCRTRLHEMVDQGKTGWDDPAKRLHILTDMCGDAIDLWYGRHKKFHDMANRAMMLWYHEQQQQQRELP